MRRSSAETREHVLAVAHEIFYWQGIKGTGVDKVAADAEVAPTTLYRLFTSKDDLVAGYVERAHVNYLLWFDEAVEGGGADPRQRILRVFDALEHQVRPENFRGCPFLMALAEYPDAAHPVHRHAVGTKEWVRTRFGELVRDLDADGADIAEPDRLADRLTLVMEGVYASAQALTVQGPAAQARDLAAALIDISSHAPTPAPARAPRRGGARTSARR
jgi:AcrR family transcriptional regulator